MKKRNMMIGSAVLLAVLLVVGGTMAWFTAETEEVANEFTAGTVEIELVDNFTAPMNVNPGDCYDKEVYVKNTGSKQAMVRVHESTAIEGFKGQGQPNIEIVEFEVHTNWEYDADTQYFYYKNVLEPNDQTEPILVNNKICFNGPLMNNDYQGAKFIITLKADAIQASNGAPNAEGWKIYPSAQ